MFYYQNKQRPEHKPPSLSEYAMAKKYQEQYCKKHKQHYAENLKKCPICRGEELDGFLKKDENN